MNIIKLTENAITPTKGSKEAAGFDLYSNNTFTIPAGATLKVTTGIAMEIPSGTFGALFARSGLATSQGLRPANCVGVIDSDYRGEIIVALHNDSSETRIIESGERIAQLIVIPYLAEIELNEVTQLDDTQRGTGGFGSTGK